MDYEIIAISEMHHDARGAAVKRSNFLNIDSFDVIQAILFLGVAETFDMSSRDRSTLKVENRCFTLTSNNILLLLYWRKH